MTTADVVMAAEPAAWSADDAKEALWALIRLLEAPAVYRVSLVEVEPGRSWRVEVHAPTGVAMTPTLRLSSLGYIWLSEAAFELPEAEAVH